MTANLRRRKIFSRIFEGLCGLAVIIALIPLAMILFYVIKEGAGALNLDFFTRMPKPVGESGGGMANAIVGTLILISIAALFAVPVGGICGVHGCLECCRGHVRFLSLQVSVRRKFMRL